MEKNKSSNQHRNRIRLINQEIALSFDKSKLHYFLQKIRIVKAQKAQLQLHRRILTDNVFHLEIKNTKLQTHLLSLKNQIRNLYQKRTKNAKKKKESSKKINFKQIFVDSQDSLSSTDKFSLQNSTSLDRIQKNSNSFSELKLNSLEIEKEHYQQSEGYQV